MSDVHLPTINAILNGLSAVWITAGVIAIKTRRIQAHKTFMLLAVSTSALFLVSYLYYHFQVGSVRFRGIGTLRQAYLAILLSHTILAMVIVPLVLVTVYRAWRLDWVRHVRVGAWTWPVWIYVSVTGVVVYWMLYWLVPSA